VREVPLIDRHDWIILFLGPPSGPYPVDQVRVKKGLFLLAQSELDRIGSNFAFEPYSYGPFDRGIYSALDALEDQALIRTTRSSGTSRRVYRLTDHGRERFQELCSQVQDEEFARLEAIKKNVTSLNFTELLRSVYEEHPDFAIRSVANL
jgi:hypothetical protein